MATMKPQICNNTAITIPDDDCDCCEVLTAKVEDIEDVLDDHEERITNNTNNFNNYYDKQEIDGKLEEIEGTSIVVVEELPEVGEPNVFYYVYDEQQGTYEQWIYQDGEWINLGAPTIDLTGYVQTDGRFTNFHDLPVTMNLGCEYQPAIVHMLGAKRDVRSGGSGDIFQDGVELMTYDAVECLVNQMMQSYCPYQVGDIMITSDDVNPSTRYPNTTWQKIQGRFIVGEGTAAGKTYGLNTTGGIKDAYLLSHTHGITGRTDMNTHSHSPYGSNTHFMYRNENNGTQTRHYVDGSGSTYVAWVSTNTNGLGSATVTATNSHHHVLEASISPSGDGSGIDANLPPYIAKYIWERTS